MKDRLLIVGTGGHAKEVFDVAQALWVEVAGFLDESSEKSEFRGLPVAQSPEALEWDSVVVAIGSNEIRRRECERFADHLSEALIHPSAVVAPSASISPGTVVLPLSVVSSDAEIGTGAIIGAQVYIGHDCSVGDFVHVATGANINGTVRIGSGTLIGTGTSVRQNISIGSDAICGAGSVVVDDVASETTVLGCPAAPRTKP